MCANPSTGQHPGVLWYLVGGVLTGLIGVAAIAAPYLFTGLIALFIGWFCLISGLFLLISALLGKTRQHRWLDSIYALVRLAVGAVLLSNLQAAQATLTLLMAAIFWAEGLVGLGFAWKWKGKNTAWIWILLNAVVALILGGMLVAKFPGDAEWVLGLLFGINSLFLGFSLIMFALAIPKAQEV